MARGGRDSALSVLDVLNGDSGNSGGGDSGGDSGGEKGSGILDR